ncbi:cytochrome P450 71A1-like [Neltuma alba]|uniref:cytochrome P450 71A1-like n=1 Tax=Neltuma alba TaxID=207710 RepID=UPI0010A562D4|nr:cytochrome P450 71A1-like [Prosopis alba]
MIVFKLIIRRGNNKLNLPPCPPKLPIIGNLHQIGGLSHRSLTFFSQKYGPLMLLQFGQIPTLVVSSANLVREMVTINDLAFSYRPSMTVPEIYFYGGKDVSLGPYGEDWRYKRKISVIEFLSLKKVRSFQFIREEEVSNMVNKIREACMKNNNVAVNLVRMVSATTWNINFRCVFGKQYETLDDKSNGFNEIVMKILTHFREFSFGDYFPSLWWMDFVTGLVPKVKANFREMDAFINHEIEQRKSGKKNTENKDFIDVLVQLQQDDDMPDVGLSLASIKTLITGMIIGGLEANATMVEWAMAELMRHPEKMKKAQEEVRRIAGKNNKSRKIIEENDVNQMSYLKCVVKEATRLHPPGPLLFPRQTNSSTVKLGGYDIPPKTSVIINAWAIQRDPNLWEKPEEFIPERFENNDVDFKSQDFGLIPFGFGRRICPGILFSVATIEYTLVNLLYWFDWKLPAHNNENGKDDIDMNETDGLLSSMMLSLHLHPIPYVPLLP